MKSKVKFGTKEIEFSIEFKNRKTTSISVEPPNKIKGYLDSSKAF